MAADRIEIEPVAHIRTPFSQKFGIPRQSGIVEEVQATIVFEAKYRNPDALRGIENFSHIWLIWGFSEIDQDSITPMARPPRLGGNEKVGVFASRSPYRPNGLGLSVVKLDAVEEAYGMGMVLRVSGADILDNSPIYDIKPYIPYGDSIPDAVGGFAKERDAHVLDVICSPEMRKYMGEHTEAIIGVLSRDPRPAYHDDPERIYIMDYADLSIRFRVEGDVLYIVSVGT